MSSTHVTPSHNPLHVLHYSGSVNLDNLVVPAANGLLRFQNPDQAVVSGYRRQVVHDIIPATAPQANFFSATNTHFDVELPEHLDSINQAELHLILKNNDSSLTTFTSVPSNLISRFEVRIGSEVKETITDIEMWVSQVPYTDPLQLIRQETSTKLDPATFKVDFAIAAATTATNIRINLPCVLTRCGIPTAGFRSPVTLRFYSQTATSVVSNATDFQLTSTFVRLYESRRRNDQLARAIRTPMDWRYLQSKIEEKSIVFASGTVIKTTLQNYSETDLCSHMWVLIRANSLAGTARDAYLSVVTNMWLEDEAGNNLTNGIQWKGTDLLNFNYPDKFTNNANSAHGLYLVFCPSRDPVADFKTGAQTGVQPLTKNMRLCINPSATATYNVTVVAMCQRHTRTENGQLSIM